MANIFEVSYSTVVTSLTEKIGRSIRTQEIGGALLSIKCRPIRIREIGDVSLSDVLYVKECCLLYLAVITFLMSCHISCNNLAAEFRYLNSLISNPYCN